MTAPCAIQDSASAHVSFKSEVRGMCHSDRSLRSEESRSLSPECFAVEKLAGFFAAAALNDTKKRHRDSSLRSRMTQRKNTMTNRHTRPSTSCVIFAERESSFHSDRSPSSCHSEQSPRSEESRSSCHAANHARAIHDSASLEKREGQNKTLPRIFYATESKVVRCAQLCA